MVTNNQKNLKELFYNFYCDILALYNNEKPKYYFSNVGNFKSEENGCSVSTDARIRLLSCSYYFDNSEKIQKLQSFKNIVKYIKSNNGILNSDGVISAPADKKIVGKKRYEVWGIDYCFGPSIYLIAQQIFENYNKSTIEINWNLEPVKINKINLNKSVLLFKLKNEHSFLPTDKYYYYIQNFTIDKKFFNLNLDKKIIQLKKLSDREKTLFINGNHFGPEDLSMDISSINTAIISKVRLSDVEIKNILTLLRLFKTGKFRLYAVGELKSELNKEKITYVNTFASIIEKPLKNKTPSFNEEYSLNENEISIIKRFFKNNYSKISENFEFAIECLSLLHSLDDKYKLPYIFFILESFFKKIKSENTYRLSYNMAKILKKSFSFTKTIRDFYNLRSDVVHGNSQSELDKKISKIKNEEQSFNDIKECVDFLEDIMKQVWKEILEKELYKKDINIEESLF
jgi:hypothetical protein